jgi:sugar lactone lactonase YvrE
MNTPNRIFVSMAVFLGLCLVTTQAQLMPQDSWVLSESWSEPGSGDGELNFPRGMAWGPDDHLYLADMMNNRIQVFDSAGTFVRQWAGGSQPWDVAVSSSGEVFVVESSGSRVQVYQADGTPVRSWGSSGGGEGQFFTPRGIAVAPDGRVWVADTRNHRIQVFESDGTFVLQFGSSGSAAGQFSQPRGITITPDELVYIGDTDNSRIQVFESDGTFIQEWVSGDPWNLEVSADGLVYVAHSGLQIYEKDGTFVRNWGGSFSGVSLAPDGRMVVSDYENDLLVLFERTYRTPGNTTSIPLPVVVSCVQRSGFPYLDVDYTILDADSPTVTVAVAAFEGGTNSLTHFVPIQTLVDGTEVNLGSNILANVTNLLSWNVAADWEADYVNLKVSVMAQDSSGMMNIGFLTLPSEGTNAALTISSSPITQNDMLPVWFWLLASGDASVSLSTGIVTGVGGAYDGLALAQGTNTTADGRACLFERMGMREATATELSRARLGPAGVTNQWTPRVTVGLEDRPKMVNEYGFDTGDWGADGWWVVPQ